jgi:flagellar biosynthesis/type III secretory pathway chaperone
MSEAETPGRLTDLLLAEMADAMASLTILMQAETEALGRPLRPGSDQAEVAAAKLRLTAMIERSVAQMHRERPDWMGGLGDEDRQRLMDTIEALDTAASRNRDMLERQLQLTGELMDAVAAEIARLSGHRAATYSAGGAMLQRVSPTPIAVNSGL